MYQTLKRRKIAKLAGRLGILALFSIIVGCAAQQYDVKGEETKKSIVVMIQKNKITPTNIKVSRGTVVIWVNGTPGTFINVYFTSGKQVEEVCTNPTRFFLNDKGNFVSGMIPPGAVASLCFLKPGTYNYMVRGMTRFEYGSVTVREE